MRRKSLLPRGGTGRSWLYLLQREDGSIKVGRSERPRSRHQQHLGESRKTGIRIVRFHLLSSFPRVEVHSAERRAIDALACRSARVGNSEEFRGIDFASALSIVRSSV